MVAFAYFSVYFCFLLFKREYFVEVMILIMPFIFTLVINVCSYVVFLEGVEVEPDLKKFPYKTRISQLINKSQNSWGWFVAINILSPILGLYLLLMLLIFAFVNVSLVLKNLAKFIFSFLKNLVKIIHNEERILVGIYSVIGG